MPQNTENITLIDSHCHLDFKAFDSDRVDVLARCAETGITDIVIPGVLAKDFNSLISLCDTNKNSSIELHYSLGLHPVFLLQHEKNDLDSLDKLLNQSQAIALGEIGLDYYLKDLDKKAQTELFSTQLDIAEQRGLPVILHVRKAHDDVLKLLSARHINSGIVHAFNGSIQQAHKYISLGFKLGFGGTLTYPQSSKLRALVKALPLDAIVLETDAPDMTVSQHRGERNSPEYLIYILSCLAELLNHSPLKLAELTTNNTKKILHFYEN